VGKYYWYEDGRRLEATGTCQQKIVRAHILEDQILGFLESVVSHADEKQTIETMNQRLVRAEERLKRAQELYLAGQINREYYETEQQNYEDITESLRKENYRATIALHELLRTELARRDALSPIEKKRLLRFAVEAAWVRGNAIVALAPTIAFLPLLSESLVDVGNCGKRGLLPPSHLTSSYLDLEIIEEKATRQDVLAILAQLYDAPETKQ